MSQSPKKSGGKQGWNTTAEAARRLGVDHKTLDHWVRLAQQQGLPISRDMSHPLDRRFKCISERDLETIAQMHEVRLAPSSEQALIIDKREYDELMTRIDKLEEELIALRTESDEVTKLRGESAMLRDSLIRLALKLAQ